MKKDYSNYFATMRLMIDKMEYEHNKSYAKKYPDEPNERFKSSGLMLRRLSLDLEKEVKAEVDTIWMENYKEIHSKEEI